jgi:hypothetical protein
MATAKDIHVAPISQRDAAALVKRIHYSGISAINANLHFGVFLDGKLEGAMQFGSSLQKDSTIKMVSNTGWNNFLELNRMAFSDKLPRNSESRSLSVAFRLIRKHYPHIEWVVSFADGTQCGDGTIYRASGFVLTACKANSTMHAMPDGTVFADVGLRASSSKLREKIGYKLGEPFSKFKARTGAKRIQGFQLRYIYFLNLAARERLTVPILPFSKIDEMGAGMYKGEKITRVKQAMTGDQPEQRRRDTDLPAPFTSNVIASEQTDKPLISLQKAA